MPSRGRKIVGQQKPAAVVPHTFRIRRAAAQLKTGAVYQRSDIVLSNGKPIPRNGKGEVQA